MRTAGSWWLLVCWRGGCAGGVAGARRQLAAVDAGGVHGAMVVESAGVVAAVRLVASWRLVRPLPDLPATVLDAAGSGLNFVEETLCQMRSGAGKTGRVPRFCATSCATD